MRNIQYRWNAGIAIFGLLLCAAPALAHHGFAAEFNINDMVTIKGVVTKTDWINPHVYIYLSAKNSDGKMEDWVFTSWPTHMLRKSGVTPEMLPTGQTLTVLAYRAKDGSRKAFTRRLIFSDGREVELWCPSTVILAPFH